jgi:hypothetical protein
MDKQFERQLILGNNNLGDIARVKLSEVHNNSQQGMICMCHYPRHSGMFLQDKASALAIPPGSSDRRDRRKCYFQQGLLSQ